MYPETLLQWLGAVGVVFGLLVVLVVLALWIHDRWGGGKDDGRAAIWLVFEVLSAVFVVAGLLTLIYSDSAVLRAIAGVAMIVLTSAATYAVLESK